MSSCAHFRGWQGGGGNKNPKTSTNAHFGDGGGRQNPKTEQSCSLSGLGGWWWWQRRAEGGQNPKNEQSCSLSGLGDGGGSENPETSIRAHFGDGGGRQRAAESRKRAVVLVFGVGRMVVVAAAGRGQVEPRKRAVVLAFGVGKMVVAAREYRNPENELNVLVFRQLVDWLTVCRIIF